MSAVRVRRLYAGDEADDSALIPLPPGVATLIIFALALLLWGAIWFGITWTIGVPLP